jgi:hypothetical protein
MWLCVNSEAEKRGSGVLCLTEPGAQAHRACGAPAGAEDICCGAHGVLWRRNNFTLCSPMAAANIEKTSA